MTDYEQLVKALRCKRDDCDGCDIAFFDKDEGWMCRYAAKDDDAAAAIEALETEIRESMQKCAECGDRCVEVVRCKECRWGHLCVTGQHLGMDGFCSKGEREVQE